VFHEFYEYLAAGLVPKRIRKLIEPHCDFHER
jgi:hypothetical protein